MTAVESKIESPVDGGRGKRTQGVVASDPVMGRRGSDSSSSASVLSVSESDCEMEGSPQGASSVGSTGGRADPPVERRLEVEDDGAGGAEVDVRIEALTRREELAHEREALQRRRDQRLEERERLVAEREREFHLQSLLLKDLSLIREDSTAGPASSADSFSNLWPDPDPLDPSSASANPRVASTPVCPAPRPRTRSPQPTPQTRSPQPSPNRRVQQAPPGCVHRVRQRLTELERRIAAAVGHQRVLSVSPGRNSLTLATRARGASPSPAPGKPAPAWSNARTATPPQSSRSLAAKLLGEEVSRGARPTSTNHHAARTMRRQPRNGSRSASTHELRHLVRMVENQPLPQAAAQRRAPAGGGRAGRARSVSPHPQGVFERLHSGVSSPRGGRSVSPVPRRTEKVHLADILVSKQHRYIAQRAESGGETHTRQFQRCTTSWERRDSAAVRGPSPRRLFGRSATVSKVPPPPPPPPPPRSAAAPTAHRDRIRSLSQPRFRPVSPSRRVSVVPKGEPWRPGGRKRNPTTPR
eukprot:TRINITY_DN811_c4_g1_i1.p1 TRINITY_DN811_c4_g1~~TRINITY_DN811_c4_g1_i1.p1  ORF type:complete len:527 (+),score=42.64 TRINITY_DN811_c4_g1_i1:589-2169(+)